MTKEIGFVVRSVAAWLNLLLQAPIIRGVQTILLCTDRSYDKKPSLLFEFFWANSF